MLRFQLSVMALMLLFFWSAPAVAQPSGWARAQTDIGAHWVKPDRDDTG